MTHMDMMCAIGPEEMIVRAKTAPGPRFNLKGMQITARSVPLHGLAIGEDVEILLDNPAMPARVGDHTAARRDDAIMSEHARIRDRDHVAVRIVR